MVYKSVPSNAASEWKEALKSVLYGGTLLAADAVCYAEQQRDRNDVTRKEYARLHGEHDRVTEFSGITVAEPRTEDEQYLPSGAVVPVAPESGTVLPVAVSADEVEWTISLLAEFPVEPAADTPGTGATALLEPSRVAAAKRALAADSEDVTVLFVSDTHLGFENRADNESGKEVPWIEEITSRMTFSRIADIALAQDVDAVIHTGDILDHEVGEITLDAAEAALHTLSMEGIPVYCIIGSHDHGSKHPSNPGSVDGVAWLQRQVEQGYLAELTMSPTRVADSPVDAYGISASNVGIDDVGKGLDWSFAEIAFGAATPGPNILCLHESTSLYRGQDGDVDVDELLAQSRVQFDCVLIGDEHSPKDDDFETGYAFETADGTPVHYTGPAIRLNEAYENHDAFVTELTISSDSITTARHSV
ncbi:exonuclease SbcCD subunit D [Halomicroarcula sp. GCM10025324]|uniref:metallophosphoesterase family protein n=1 Tax=Haloarcula TaxID=2237 RepID=UPI0023E83341|nr:metallophosphoesterase [Halomicroarcula sp. ZS-22-S1]